MKLKQATSRWITVLYKDWSFDTKFNSQKTFRQEDVEWLNEEEKIALYNRLDYMAIIKTTLLKKDWVDLIQIRYIKDDVINDTPMFTIENNTIQLID